MKFKDFMDMYDNWNRVTIVNGESLTRIAKGKTYKIMDKRTDLYDREVESFGFYEDILTVRLK